VLAFIEGEAATRGVARQGHRERLGYVARDGALAAGDLIVGGAAVRVRPAPG
jgi:hypothetical protein